MSSVPYLIAWRLESDMFVTNLIEPFNSPWILLFYAKEGHFTSLDSHMLLTPNLIIFCVLSRTIRIEKIEKLFPYNTSVLKHTS
jgi:hypothetical protein